MDTPINTQSPGTNSIHDEPKLHLKKLNHLIQEQADNGNFADNLKEMGDIIKLIEKKLIKNQPTDQKSINDFKEEMTPLLQSLGAHAEEYYDTLSDVLRNSDRIGPKEYLSLETPLKLYSSCNQLIKHLTNSVSEHIAKLK
ncbi:MAG: hypothetical protein JHC93_06960 [Parachlamydiales bacterium]|nr:hypothetical protein [Parachlamydiales bacterium]